MISLQTELQKDVSNFIVKLRVVQKIRFTTLPTLTAGQRQTCYFDQKAPKARTEESQLSHIHDVDAIDRTVLILWIK